MRFLRFSLIVCGIALAASSVAHAAFIYDLRFADGSKSTVAAANTSYTLQLWGQITGDADKTNDYWQSGYVSIDALKVGGGAFSNPGNLSTVGVTGAVLGSHANTGAIGTQRTTPFIDNIRGWGGSSNAATSGWLLWRGGNNPGYQGGVFDAQSVNLGANGQEVLLATFTVQTGANINLSGALGDATQFALRTQATVTNPGAVQALLYGNDTSTGTLLNMTTGSASGLTTSVSFLAPTAAIPEPGTLALGSMLLVGCAGWQLRRKKVQS